MKSLGSLLESPEYRLDVRNLSNHRARVDARHRTKNATILLGFQ